LPIYVFDCRHARFIVPQYRWKNATPCEWLWHDAGRPVIGHGFFFARADEVEVQAACSGAFSGQRPRPWLGRYRRLLAAGLLAGRAFPFGCALKVASVVAQPIEVGVENSD
jgi:hypothetical protein